MIEHPVTFKSKGQQVVGMLHAPAPGKTQVPGVLFLHGFTGNKAEFHRSFVRAARLLARAGLASLRIDFRGSGDSEGAFVDMTPSGELADARAALRFLRRQPEVNPGRVAVLGMSFGGLIAAFLTADAPTLAAAVLWAPVGDTKLMIRRRMTPAARRQLKRMGCMDMAGWALGEGFVREAPVFKPLKAIEGARCPILLIQGDQDQAVPIGTVRDYQRAVAKSGQEMATHLVIGAGHGFESLAWEDELIATTLKWLAGKLLL